MQPRVPLALHRFSTGHLQPPFRNLRQSDAFKCRYGGNSGDAVAFPVRTLYLHGGDCVPAVPILHLRGRRCLLCRSHLIHHSRFFHKHLLIQVVHITRRHYIAGSCPVLANGIVLHTDFLCQPLLTFVDGGKLGTAFAHQPQTVRRGSFVCQHDAQFFTASYDCAPHLVRIVDTVDVQYKNAAGLRQFVFAGFLKESLPCDYRQFLFQFLLPFMVAFHSDGGAEGFGFRVTGYFIKKFSCQQFPAGGFYGIKKCEFHGC